MVDPVGTPLAVIGTVDLCLKYGKRLLKKYKAYQNAPHDIQELILIVENHWIKFEYQTQFLRTVWDSLDDRLLLHQHHLIHHLQNKLQQANDLIDQTIGSPTKSASIESLTRKTGDLHRTKYALFLRESLEQMIKDLKKWHDLFDPSWFLLIRSSSLEVDRQLSNQLGVYNDPSVTTLKRLRQAIQTAQSEAVSGGSASIWLQSDMFVERRHSIPESSIQLTHDRSNAQDVLVDTFVSHPQTQLSQVTRDVRDLGRILSQTDPKVFGLLKCVGIIQETPSILNTMTAKFELILQIPDGLRTPISLRTLLREDPLAYALNERFDLARSLASSVMFIHSSKLVHKSIRPDTTIVFEDDRSRLAAPFLVGFEKFRPIDGRTIRVGDALWHHDLYRHPSRQGLQPEEDYIMQHDIYSLGVLLLEIGLWTSFVAKPIDTGPFTANPVLDISEALLDHNMRRRAATIKRRLINLASTRLASRMGGKYSDVVLACLTCLDRDDNRFGDQDQFVDQDGIVVGVRFIEMVIMKLHEISV